MNWIDIYYTKKNLEEGKIIPLKSKELDSGWVELEIQSNGNHQGLDLGMYIVSFSVSGIPSYSGLCICNTEPFGKSMPAVIDNSTIVYVGLSQTAISLSILKNGSNTSPSATRIHARVKKIF